MIFRMPTPPAQPRDEADQEILDAWNEYMNRVRIFRVQKFTEDQAARLAIMLVEPEETQGLLSRNCPHHLVLEILI